jgi:hypothetical protein
LLQDERDQTNTVEQRDHASTLRGRRPLALRSNHASVGSDATCTPPTRALCPYEEVRGPDIGQPTPVG